MAQSQGLKTRIPQRRVVRLGPSQRTVTDNYTDTTLETGCCDFSNTSSYANAGLLEAKRQILSGTPSSNKMSSYKHPAHKR